MPTTLVTGAGGTLGTAICSDLTARGHEVIGIARRPIAEFAGVFYSVDLANAASTEAALAGILAEHRIDNLVNNAGASGRAALEDVDIDAAHAMYELNVHATVRVTKALLPTMRANGRGRIVNMCSRAMLGRERTSIYASSKAAVEGLTRSWAIEFADSAITVNAVAPGFIYSEMFERNNPPDSPQTQRDLSRVPLGRLGQADEVAAAVAYFLSDEAGYTTGQTLYVCGGWSI
ncbi:SDR family oxidoreductase [Novosphingobium sp. BL-52-GroH]|uniref:SDR family oxidoreductase n=1 Tax=Novosphingobium sp. BL-52-GroH TaxID=3349877 RepID=UPI00384DCCCE